jgi:cytochrome c oxidase cbb3-type subunit 3
MKFIHYLEGISGISIYPMFSLMVFFVFFMVLLFLVVRMRKSTIDTLKNLPLDDRETSLANDSSTTINML